jgi:hypothetical protein
LDALKKADGSAKAIGDRDDDKSRHKVVDTYFHSDPERWATPGDILFGGDHP